MKAVSIKYSPNYFGQKNRQLHYTLQKKRVLYCESSRKGNGNIIDEFEQSGFVIYTSEAMQIISCSNRHRKHFEGVLLLTLLYKKKFSLGLEFCHTRLVDIRNFNKKNVFSLITAFLAYMTINNQEVSINALYLCHDIVNPLQVLNFWELTLTLELSICLRMKNLSGRRRLASYRRNQFRHLLE